MNNIKFRKIKKEIRILGIDDGPFDFRKDKKTVIVGVMFRAGFLIGGGCRKGAYGEGKELTPRQIGMLKKKKNKKKNGSVSLM